MWCVQDMLFFNVGDVVTLQNPISHMTFKKIVVRIPANRETVEFDAGTDMHATHTVMLNMRWYKVVDIEYCMRSIKAVVIIQRHVKHMLYKLGGRMYLKLARFYV